MTPQPPEQPRTDWVRYRLTKGDSELTFRVIRGTAMILEQSGWHVESEYIEGRTSAPDPVASPTREALEAILDVFSIENLRPATAAIRMAEIARRYYEGQHVTPTNLGDFEIREGYYGPLGPDPVASPADHDCLMPSACGVTGFYCSNATQPPVATPAPLDVERLARAMTNTRTYGPNPETWARLAAKRIAAEYAALEGQPVAEEPEG